MLSSGFLAGGGGGEGAGDSGNGMEGERAEAEGRRGTGSQGLGWRGVAEPRGRRVRREEGDRDSETGWYHPGKTPPTLRNYSLYTNMLFTSLKQHGILIRGNASFSGIRYDFVSEGTKCPSQRTKFKFRSN
jgi:hypothetical protein